MKKNHRNIDNLEWILRVGIFLTFLGHGVIAFQRNEGWAIYLETVGFSNEMALNIMPYIGILDILVAIMILVYPMKVVILWAFVWAFSTALIRFVAGDPIWAFVERGSNWVLPLALLLYQIKKNKMSDIKNNL